MGTFGITADSIYSDFSLIDKKCKVIDYNALLSYIKAIKLLPISATSGLDNPGKYGFQPIVEPGRRQTRSSTSQQSSTRYYTGAQSSSNNEVTDFTRETMTDVDPNDDKVYAIYPIEENAKVRVL